MLRFRLILTVGLLLLLLPGITQANSSALSSEQAPAHSFTQVSNRLVLFVFNYFDRNGDGRQQLNEPPLAGATITLYDATGRLIASKTSPSYGLVLFTQLSRGTYTICQALDAPWRNTQPGVISPQYNQACYTRQLSLLNRPFVFFGSTFPLPSFQMVALTPEVVPGGTATFQITVDNWTVAWLGGVSVVDPLVPDCNRDIGTLYSDGTNSHYSYTCEGVVTEGFTNRAVLSARPMHHDYTGYGITLRASAQASVAVVNASLSIDMYLASVSPDGTAFFDVWIFNTGDEYLYEVTVDDPLAPDCSIYIGNGPPNGTLHREICMVDATEDFTNVITVTGHTASGVTVTATDSVFVNLWN